MEREETSRSREYSRRTFLKKLGVAGAVAVGGLYISGKLPFERPPLEEYDDLIDEIRKNYPNARWIDHNAANNPFVRKAAIAGPAINIEADGIDFEKQPYIAHSLPEFKKDLKINPELIELQRADVVFREIVDSGKNPAIDIKPQSQEGFDRLMLSVQKNIPEDTVVTFSGEPKFVLQAAQRRNSIIIPTYQPWEIEEYKSHADNEWKDYDPSFIRFGASLGPNFRDRQLQDLLRFNIEHDLELESNMWIIDDLSRMITLLRWGATGITTNNRQIIGRATQHIK